MATAIITGASQGIGACIAKRLAQDGFDVVINHYPSDGDKEKALAVAEECRKLGVKAECYAADVSKFDQCEAMVKQVKADFGTIDALVNNAGITKDKLLARMSEDEYDAVIAVNQKSVFNMTKFVTAVMMKQRSGRIVNVASVAGLYGNPGQMNYSASKAAIIAARVF
jgi:3-oxoacyl-[acyl-carrier protein] reductase